jgi:hypothetical protein
MTALTSTEQVSVESVRPIRYYRVEKWFYDYAENIEAVNIHYACTPLGEVPDWNSQRATRFLPLVESHLRRKVLKLPVRIHDRNHRELTDRYLLHHYFEIFADDDMHYSSLYTDEIVTGAGRLPAPQDSISIPAVGAASGADGRTSSNESPLIREP